LQHLFISCNFSLSTKASIYQALKNCHLILWTGMTRSVKDAD